MEPERGAALFAFEEHGPDKASLLAQIDRLAERARAALNDGDAGRARVRVADALTANFEAYQHYFLGVQCLDRPVHGLEDDCSDNFRKAVALDPAFAAAHYQLAIWTHYYGAPRAEQRAALERAQRSAGRGSPKEQLLIRAWAAYLDGRDEDALTLYRRVSEAWPDDKRTFYEAGDLLRHQDRFEDALPWFRAALALDGNYGWPLDHVVEALGILGRRDELEARVREWERNPNPATLHALSAAYGWLGRVAAAAQAARRAEALGAGLAAQEDLLAAATFAGAYAPAERACRTLAEPGSPVRRLGHYAVAALSAYQGRRRAGLAELDALRRDLPAVATDAIYLSLRADYLLGDGDPAAVWREVEALRAIDPRAAAQHAPALAWLGDDAHAALLAADLPPGSLLARTHAAVARWNRGETDAALEELRALTEKTPASVWRLAPLYLYADLAARAGRDQEAVDALAQFQAMYLPRMMWRSWAYPRSLLLTARSLERLGEHGRAREALRKLLDAWDGGDRDDPLLLEARALRARLEDRPVRRASSRGR